MDIAAPLWLSLPLIAVMATMLARGQAAALPGDWGRLAQPSLRPALSRLTSGLRARGRPVRLVALWALIGLALSGLTVDRGAPAAIANLTGRVIVMDLSPDSDVDAARAAATAMLDAAPDTPTALVAMTADAFDIAPMTTDRDHLNRYLAVLSPDAMPVEGRAIDVAMSHAEGLLARAGVLAGQVMLVSGGAAPVGASPQGADVLRAVVATSGDPAAWRRYAEQSGAALLAPSDIAAAAAALTRLAQDHRRGADWEARADLTPVFVILAGLLWLPWFRRRGS